MENLGLFGRAQPELPGIYMEDGWRQKTILFNMETVRKQDVEETLAFQADFRIIEIKCAE